MNKKDSLGVPDIFLFVCNEIIIFDNEENAVHIVLNKRTDKEDSYESAIKRIDNLEKIIKQKTAFKNYKNSLSKDSFSSSFKKEGFLGCSYKN